MKLEKRIWMAVLVGGLGSMLLLPGSVRAQQEIDPTIFDVNPGVPQNAAAVPVPAAAQNVEPARATEGQTQMPTDHVDAAQASNEDTSLLRILMGCAGVIMLGGIAQAMRQRARQSSQYQPQ